MSWPRYLLSLPGVLRRPPEPLESFPVGRLAQLFECPLADLSDALAGDAHEGADLLERHRLRAFFEAVVEIEDLAFARRQVFLEDAFDELAHQLAVCARL